MQKVYLVHTNENYSKNALSEIYGFCSTKENAEKLIEDLIKRYTNEAREIDIKNKYKAGTVKLENAKREFYTIEECPMDVIIFRSINNG